MKKGLKVTFDLILIMILLAEIMVIAGGKAMEARIERQDKAIEEMNATELHYDADDYFMMVDKGGYLIGFYDAATPLRHIYVTEYNGIRSIPDGVYEAYIQSGTIVLVNADDDSWATTIPIPQNDAAWAAENYPGGYPALVYE